MRIGTKLGIYQLVFLLPLLLAFDAGAQQYREVKPEPGDGVFSLLRRYNMNPSDYFNTFIDLNKNKLGDDLQLKKHEVYRLPVSESALTDKKPETGVFPIFGKEYKEVEFKDNQLQGAIYYIVAGHGGPDPGAVGKKDGHLLCEDEYAYDIALRLARSLLEHNATVYLITRDPDDGIRDQRFLECDKDEYCYGDLQIPINPTRRLRQRVDEINKLYDKYRGRYQRMVELHVDSRYHGQNVDVFFYYHPGSTKGKELNQTLYRTIKAKYDEHQPGRGYRGTVTSRRLYMIRNTKPVSSYIELGNINHQRDQQRIIKVDNRQAIANWLTLGLIKDFEMSK